MEPLLGPVTHKPEWLEKLDWIIIGGEPGGHARPMHPAWVRAAQKQCEASGVQFFFKQWGCWSPDENFARPNFGNVAYFRPGANEPIMLQELKTKERRVVMENQEGKTFMFRSDKHKAGKLLDGRIHEAHPFGCRISQ